LKHLNFEVKNFEITDKDPDSQFAYAKIQAFASEKNEHDLICSEKILKKTAPTIFNKPILYTINKVVDDFGSHTASDKSLICGFVVPESAEFIRLGDNRTALNVTARLWKRYAPKAINILKRDSGYKGVSVEMDLFESESRDDGLEEMLDFSYSGICLLGDYVKEASPGSHIEMLSFSKDNEDYKKAIEIEFGKYDSLDMSIPAKVRENAQEGLDLHKKYNIGGNSVLLAIARHLIKNEEISPEKIKSIIKLYKSSKFKNVKKIPPTADYIAYYLLGGVEGMLWANELFEKITELDEKYQAYFGKFITFPYDSLKDVNPAILGIDPPVNLQQANYIAKTAESIGIDNKKNGWAIAISQFKKTHKVEDEGWVKKEKLEKEVNNSVLKSEILSKNFSLTSSQVIEILDSAFSEFRYGEHNYKKFFIRDFDESFVYVWDNEIDKTFRFNFILTGNGANIDFESKKEVIHGGFKLVNENEETFSEKPEEDSENKSKEDIEMSNDASLDIAAMLAFLQEETDDYKTLVAEFSDEGKKDFYKLTNALFNKGMRLAEKCESQGSQKEEMYRKVTQMESENKAYMEENEELKKFKSGIETKQYEFAIDSTLKEIEGSVEIPQIELEKLREKSKNYTFETVDIWKNEAKAIAFNFVAKDKTKDEVKRYALPWESQNNQKSSGLWK